MESHFAHETHQAARELLGYEHFAGGYPPSSFRQTLFELWQKADRHNRARLAMAFPAEAVAVETFSSFGVEGLTELANGHKKLVHVNETMASPILAHQIAARSI